MSKSAATGPVIDLPPRIKQLFITAFGFGLVLIAAGSLYIGEESTIGTDKIIHFSAYTLLATVLILGVRFKLALVGLVLLALASYLIEFIQPYFGRSKDFGDALANTAGVCIGAGVGFLFRLLTSRIWTELQQMRVERYKKTFPKGSTLIAAGKEQHEFFIIVSGKVEVLREVDGVSKQINTLAEGNCVGLISDALNIVQEDTIVALKDTEVYALDYETVIEESGGEKQPVAIIMKGLISQLHKIRNRIADLNLNKD